MEITLFSLQQVLLAFLKMEEEGEGMFGFFFSPCNSSSSSFTKVLVAETLQKADRLGKGPSSSQCFSLGAAPGSGDLLKQQRNADLPKPSFTGFMV